MTYANLTELTDAIAAKVRRVNTDPDVIAAASSATEYVAYDNDLTPPVFTVTDRARTSDVATLNTATDHGIAVGEEFTVADVGAGFDGVYLATSGAVPASGELFYTNVGDDVVKEAVAAGTVCPTSATSQIPDKLNSPLTFQGLTLLGARIVVDTPTPDGQVVATADPTFGDVFVPESLAAHLRDYWRRDAETMGAA